MDSIRRVINVVLLAAIVLAASPGLIRAQNRYIVPRLTGPVLFDGPSDEPAWQAIEPLPVVQQEPLGLPPSKLTEIRIGYDDHYLYLAGRLYSHPDSIHGPSLKRDELEPTNDYVGLILDTFNDNENGLAFFTSPTGIRLDFNVFNDAQPVTPDAIPMNSSWDTFWDTAVVQTEEGWFAEIRIPFSSLRFQDVDGRVVMGLIVWRWIARGGEVDIFPAIPASWGAWSAFKPSQGIDAVFEGIESRRPLYVTPYLLGGGGFTNELNDPETAYIHDRSRIGEIGLDAKYSLTSNLTMDLTLNTDFAQVEADDQQVNLTRFSLFFPEKRRFFQERSSAFNVSLGAQNQIFYSRRIGLYEGRQIPIVGGARLVGRVGAWDVGGLTMHTEKDPGGELPPENFSVLRLRRQVFNENSYMGGIVTSRTGRDGSYNAVYGLDGIFRIFDDDWLTVIWAQSFEDSVGNGSNALDPARIRVDWERRNQDGFFYGFSAARAGPDWNPGMGFEMREDYTSLRQTVGYGWIGAADSPINRHNLSATGLTWIRNSDRKVDMAEFGPNWSVFYKSYAGLNIAVKAYYEDLTEAFELSDEVSVPVGDYTYYGVEATYGAGGSNLLRHNVFLTAGTFYDGSRIVLGLQPVWSISPQLNLSGFLQINRVDFPDRNEEFNAYIGRLRAQITLTTEISAIAFVQYNSAIDAVISNFKFRYNPREGNDLYIVYNEGINLDRMSHDPVRPYNSDRTLMLKYAYTFIF